MIALYEEAMEEEATKANILSRLIVGKDIYTRTGKKDEQSKGPDKGSNEEPIFGRPGDYKDMSMEEKQKLTNQMMGSMKKWAGQAERILATKG